ncbi:MAG: hypothetical protein GY862_13475 [Gammaproteobacteria bacterium]|nr:hypothetical protein [Gammaproteobacteria bacterium]
MLTACTECKHKFEVDDNSFGQLVECPKCKHKFSAIWYIDKLSKKVNVVDDFEEEKTEENKSIKKRKTSKEIIAAKVAFIEAGINDLIPMIRSASASDENESNTRLILDRILLDVLGYKIEDLKTEQKIQGRKADYVISVNNDDILVIEAKRIGMVLKDRQIGQATAYGAYAGIKWALLTNVEVWKLYYVFVGEKVEANHIFTLDLRNSIETSDAQYLYLLSKDGIVKKNMLEKLRQKNNALSCANLINTILSDEIVSKIRVSLTKSTGCKLINDEVREALEKDLFQSD